MPLLPANSKNLQNNQTDTNRPIVVLTVALPSDTWFISLPSIREFKPLPHIYALDKICLLADYLHQLILGGHLRVPPL